MLRRLTTAPLAALLVFAANPTFAADPAVGKWLLAFKMPGGGETRTADLELSGETSLTAILKSPLGEAKIDNVTNQAGQYVASYTMERAGKPMKIVFRAALAGSDLQGNLELSGGAIKVPVTGVRAGSEGELALRLSLLPKPAAAPAATAAASPAAAEARTVKVAAAVASAESAPLAFADLGPFAGEWVLVVESQRGAQKAPFVFKDENGQAVGELTMQPPLGKQVMRDIRKTATGLALHYSAKFGSQAFDITMTLAIEGGQLKGEIADDGGMFQLPVAGARKGEALPASAAAVDTNESGSGGRAPRREREEAITDLSIGGASLEINYGQPSLTDPGVNGIPRAVPEGTIWPMGRELATRLKTTAPLMVGGKRIEPGRYGLWARRTADGWNLVINAKPDVWSTQHRPEADLAEVPFERSAAASPAEKLTLTLKADGNAALLIAEWGGDRLTARLAIAQ